MSTPPSRAAASEARALQSRLAAAPWTTPHYSSGQPTHCLSILAMVEKRLRCHQLGKPLISTIFLLLYNVRNANAHAATCGSPIACHRCRMAQLLVTGCAAVPHTPAALWYARQLVYAATAHMASTLHSQRSSLVAVASLMLGYTRVHHTCCWCAPAAPGSQTPTSSTAAPALSKARAAARHVPSRPAALRVIHRIRFEAVKLTLHTDLMVRSECLRVAQLLDICEVDAPATSTLRPRNTPPSACSGAVMALQSILQSSTRP
jgi:hypothetical protein